MPSAVFGSINMFVAQIKNKASFSCINSVLPAAAQLLQFIRLLVQFLDFLQTLEHLWVPVWHVKTPRWSSCLSGLHVWCQHSWVYSKACAHKLAANVSIKTALHFPQRYWHFTWFWLRALCIFTSVNCFSLVYFFLTDVREFCSFFTSLIMWLKGVRFPTSRPPKSSPTA